MPLILLLSAQTGCTSFRDCATEDATAAAELPARLSQTGLYSDIGEEVVAEGAIEFTPRFPLWTDGAKKRRWLLLPEGEQVDTSNAQEWGFPVGTRTFKEFERDDRRLETRMNLRTEQGWAAVAYIWEGDDAVRSLEGMENAGGTEHDVPGAAECLTCHAGRGNFTLGFSATQLPPETRAELFDAGVLSQASTEEIAVSPTVKAGLGLLHGNCSHCHNETRHEQAQATECYAPVAEDVFDLTLPPDLGSLEDAPAVNTARWQLGDNDGESEILARMSERNLSERNPSMPPLGTEITDEEGIAAVEAFLDELEASGL